MERRGFAGDKPGWRRFCAGTTTYQLGEQIGQVENEASIVSGATRTRRGEPGMRTDGSCLTRDFYAFSLLPFCPILVGGRT
jgi:hypothetical protein